MELSLHADFLSVCGWLNRRQKNRAESGNLHGLPACYDDSGDYWCKNLLCCIFMDSYKDNIPEIFNLRHGGLGIVGGVAMAVLVLFLFAKAKKQSALLMLDTMTMGLLIGQIMGR